MLDDTTIREYLRDDYPTVVDALALVTGDVRGAEDAVQEAILLAWTQSEPGEPIEALASRVTSAALHLLRKGLRRLGADRRSRTRLRRGAVTDEGDVRRALAHLTRRQREVAVLRFVLGKTPREIADTLGVRDATAERTLAEARTTLSALLLEDEESDAVDDGLTDRLQTVQRRAAADPRLFERLVFSLTRHERVKRMRGVGSVAAVIAIGAGVFVMLDRSGPGDAGEPSPSTVPGPGLPFDAAALPGVPFPACHVSAAHSYSQGWFGVVYLFARGATSEPCPGVNAGNAYLALDRGGLGRPEQTTVFGPIECFNACRAFGTPDVDGDGWNEMAVVVGAGSDVDAIELYRVHPRGSSEPFTQITTVDSGERGALAFEWGGAGTHRSGAYCSTPASSASWDLALWSATRRSGVWHVLEQRFRIHGATATPVGSKRSSTTDPGLLPDGGDLEFCGASVDLSSG